MLATLILSALQLVPGRQLLFDDELIEATNLRRDYHYPEKFDGNPVLKPETPDEIHAPFDSTARPNGGGLWWDSARGVFRLWYEAGWLWSVAYAESRDGIHWTRPALDVVPGTNLVFPREWNLHPDSWSVVPDPSGSCWWMFLREPGGTLPGWLLKSPDGIHWTKTKETGRCGDRSTLFYDPFRAVWVYSLRSFSGKWMAPDGTRARRYHAAADIITGADWNWDDFGKSHWLLPDALDPKDPLIKRRPQLYNFDAVAYESIMLGMWETHHGPENNVCEKAGLPKITDLMFAYSRDGYHFLRPDRTPAIASERWASDKWDRGYVQSLSNVMVVMGDELWFYYGAFRGDPTRLNAERETGVPGWNPGNSPRNGLYHNAAMGLAKLRRDGFVSMSGTGFLRTKPLVANGRYLFANFKGELSVRVNGSPDMHTVSGDSTRRLVAALAALDGKEAQLEFSLKDGDLYSFWFAKDESGKSGGYLAGGGPGYKGLKDE